MYKEILNSINHIEVFPIISFVIFFCFFTFLLFQVWRTDKALMNRLSFLPLDLNENDQGLKTEYSSKGKTIIEHD